MVPLTGVGGRLELTASGSPKYRKHHCGTRSLPSRYCTLSSVENERFRNMLNDWVLFRSRRSLFLLIQSLNLHFSESSLSRLHLNSFYTEIISITTTQQNLSINFLKKIN